MIATWWAALSPAMKVLWAVTLTASLIFIIQSIATFIGADSDTGGLDMDVDTGGGLDDVSNIDGGSNLYTFRNFVNFFLGFGWTSILLHEKVSSTALFKWLGSMQQSGNINVYKSAVGCQGKVYLTIPAARSGEGKVQITINNSVREYNAVTDGDVIKNGTAIKVTEVLNDSTLLVEELNSLII